MKHIGVIIFFYSYFDCNGQHRLWVNVVLLTLEEFVEKKVDRYLKEVKHITASNKYSADSIKFVQYNI